MYKNSYKTEIQKSPLNQFKQAMRAYCGVNRATQKSLEYISLQKNYYGNKYIKKQNVIKISIYLQKSVEVM